MSGGVGVSLRSHRRCVVGASSVQCKAIGSLVRRWLDGKHGLPLRVARFSSLLSVGRKGGLRAEHAAFRAHTAGQGCVRGHT